MGPFDSKRFKALQARWYAKLAKSGFVDIEREDGTLIDREQERYAKEMPQDVAKAREAYYRAAEHYMTRAGAMTKRDLAVWRLHVEGCNNTEIAEALGLARATVTKIVAKHRAYVLNASRLASTEDT